MMSSLFFRLWNAEHSFNGDFQTFILKSVKFITKKRMFTHCDHIQKEMADGMKENEDYTSSLRNLETHIDFLTVLMFAVICPCIF